MLFAAVLRVLIEVANLTASALGSSFAMDLCQRFETGARLFYFIGVPAFLLLRILA